MSSKLGPNGTSASLESVPAADAPFAVSPAPIESEYCAAALVPMCAGLTAPLAPCTT